MDYLARESAPFEGGFWDKIDETVIKIIRDNLTGRRFIPVWGPLGAGTRSIPVDETVKREEFSEDGVVKTVGRRFVELPQLFEDFTLYWRDLEASEKDGTPLELTNVMIAARNMAIKEDRMIFFGNEFLGTEGIMTAQGVNRMEKKDWSVGENAFQDLSEAIALLESKGILGKYTLVVSPDVYVKLQRIQPGTGVMEIERVKNLFDGRVMKSFALGSGNAFIVCSERQYIDLAIGQDVAASYLELKDLNHVFRIIETLALRIKCRDAIVVFE